MNRESHCSIWNGHVRANTPDSSQDDIRRANEELGPERDSARDDGALLGGHIAEAVFLHLSQPIPGCKPIAESVPVAKSI